MDIIPLICPFIFPCNKIYRRRFLHSYDRQSSYFVYTYRGWKIVCKRNLTWFVVFSFFHFFHLSSLCLCQTSLRNYKIKDFESLYKLGLTCCTMSERIIILMPIIPLFFSCFSFFLIKIHHKFHIYYSSLSLQILSQRYFRNYSTTMLKFILPSFFPYSISHSNVMHRKHCVSAVSQEILHLGFWTIVQTLGTTSCIV